MSSSVKAKAIFPSISITKKKGKTGSGTTPQTSNAQSLLRPLTPVCNADLLAFASCDLGYFKQAMNCCFFFVVLKESIRKQAPPSPSEPGRSFPALGASPAHSPSLSRWTNSGETNLSALENGYQLSQSAPDLRIGYRHVRSISQPVKPVAATSHRESFSSVTFPDRSNSVNSDTSYYAEAAEVPMIVQEDIIALTCHVRTFSEALGSLRNTFIECEGKTCFSTMQSTLYTLCTCIKSTYFYSNCLACGQTVRRNNFALSLRWFC